MRRNIIAAAPRHGGESAAEAGGLGPEFLREIKGYAHAGAHCGKVVRKQCGGFTIMPVISKITAKGQTTVPQEVRAALNSKPGDLIAWDIEPDGRVAVRRIQPADVEYLQAVQGTLSEWRSAEDEQAYGKL